MAAPAPARQRTTPQNGQNGVPVTDNGHVAVGRVRTDGKFFTVGGARFPFRGVTYGTFSPRDDGALFPAREQIRADFATMREAGFTVVRTYTAPPDDLLEAAADHRLHVLADVFYPDWRYLLGGSRRESRAVARRAACEVRETARRLAGCESVLALSLGNEIPADVLRWYGGSSSPPRFAGS